MRKLLAIILLLAAASAITELEACDYGLGKSNGNYTFYSSEHFCEGGNKDCCGWYQYRHEHQLRQSVSNADLYVEYRPGFKNNCQSTLTIQVSNDGMSWTTVKTIPTQSIDLLLDGNPDFPEQWKNYETTVENVAGPFKFIRLENPTCFLDFSYVSVSDIDEPIAELETNGNTITYTADPSFVGFQRSEFHPTHASYKLEVNGATIKSGRPHTWPVTGTHTITGDGTYNILLTVTDGKGRTATDSETLVLDTRGPAITITAPQASDVFTVDEVKVEFDSSELATFEYSRDGVNWYTTEQGGTSRTAVEYSTNAQHTTITASMRPLLLAGFVKNKQTLTQVNQNTPIILSQQPTAPQPTTPPTQPSTATIAASQTITLPAQQTITTQPAPAPQALTETPATRQEDPQTTTDNAEPRTATRAQYSHIFINLPEGQNTLYVRGTDSNGNTGPAASVTIRVDTVAPDLAITSPADNFLTTNHEITMKYHSNAADKAMYYIKNETITWITKNLVEEHVFWIAEGTHTLKARVVDSAGHQTEVQISVEVDSTYPTIEITSPAEGAYLNTQAVTVRYNAQDMDIVLYQLKADAGTWMTAPPSAMTISLAEGYHIVYVRAKDDAGNYCPEETVSFYVDLNAPTVSITSPSGTITADAYTLTWTGSDAIGIQKYEVRQDSGSWIPLSSSTNSYGFTGLTDGTHTLEVRATDHVSRTDTDSVTIDVQTGARPQVKIQTPTEGEWYTTLTDFTVIATDDQTTVMDCEWEAGGAPIPFTITNNTPQTMTFSLGDGQHTLKVTCSDGFYSEQDLVAFIIDAAAPDAIITSPAENAHYDAWNNVSVHYTSSTPSDVNHSEYNLDSGAWTPDWNGAPTGFRELAEGPHDLCVRNVDALGLAGTEDCVHVTVNILPPTISLVLPVNNTDTTARFETRFISNDEFVSAVDISIDGAAWIESYAPASKGSASVIMFELPYGQHDINARARDSYGLTSNVVTLHVNVNNGGEEVVIDSPQNNTLINHKNMTWHATVPASIVYYEVKEDSGTWSNVGLATEHEFAPGDGSHQFYARAWNGAQYGPETMINADIDTIAPTAIVTGPIENSNYSNNPVQLLFDTISVTDLDYVECRADAGAWFTTQHSNACDFELSDGMHYLEARAIDLAGNEGAVDGRTVNMDSSAPIVTISSPLPGTSFLVDDITVTFRTTAANIESFQYSYDGYSWQNTGITNPQPNTDHTFTFTDLSAGSQTLYIRGINDVGSIGAAASVQIYVNLAVSAVVIDSPQNNTLINHKNMTWHATVPAAVAFYEVKADAGGWNNIGTATQYTFPISDGDHQLYVRAWNGTQYGPETMINVTIDTIAPPDAILGPANGTYTATYGVGFYYNASVVDDFDYFEVRVDGGPWVVDLDLESPARVSMSPGLHKLEGRIVDIAGNKGTIGERWYTAISNNMIVTISSPSSGASFDVDDIQVTFRTNATDIYEFQYSYDGYSWQNTGITNPQPNTDYTFTFTNVEEGNSTLYIRGRKEIGTISTAASVAVHVDSLFTNMYINMCGPYEEISSTPFPAVVFVQNTNEETVYGGQYQVNLTVNGGTNILYGQDNPQYIWTLEPMGDDAAEWLIEGSAPGGPWPITACLLWEDGRFKCDTNTVTFTWTRAMK